MFHLLLYKHEISVVLMFSKLLKIMPKLREITSKLMQNYALISY